MGLLQTWRGVLRHGICAFIALSVIATPLSSATAEQGSSRAAEASASEKVPNAPPGITLVDEYGNKIIDETQIPEEPAQPKVTKEKPEAEIAAKATAKEVPAANLPVVVSVEEPLDAEAPVPLEPEQSSTADEMRTETDSEVTLSELEVAVILEGESASTKVTLSDLETVWFNTSGGVLARGEEVLAKRSALGLENIDGLSRAVLLSASPEQMIQTAGLANRLSPDLPFAHMQAARALRVKEGLSREVLLAYVEVFKAVGRNMEASLWLEALVLRVLAWMLALGALTYFLLVAGKFLLLAAHDIADLFPVKVPLFSAAALLGFFVLLPGALGEGALGIALVLFVICVCYSGFQQRITLSAAAFFFLISIHGLGVAADARLEALSSQSLVKLVNTAFRGMLEPGEIARLREAATISEVPIPLVREAYAHWLVREGELEEAEALYALLVKEESSLVPVYLLNNAANLKMELKKLPEAIALYQQAEALISAGFGAPSEQALVLLNLSRAYGEDFKLNKQDEVMHRAQAVSEETVTLSLAEAQHDSGRTFELVPSSVFMERMLLAEGLKTTGDLPLQQLLAPGRVGGSLIASTLSFGLCFFIAMMAVKWRPQSFACESCGCDCCPRCRKENSVKDQLCGTCVRLLKRPETVEVNLRIEKIAELKLVNQRRSRKALIMGVLVPGAAGLIVKRPMVALVSLFAAMLIPVVLRADLLAIPDPYLMGGIEEIVLAILLAIAVLTYVVLLAVLVPMRRNV